jgi:hypothetical protein
LAAQVRTAHRAKSPCRKTDNYDTITWVHELCTNCSYLRTEERALKLEYGYIVITSKLYARNKTYLHLVPLVPGTTYWINLEELDRCSFAIGEYSVSDMLHRGYMGWAYKHRCAIH